MRKPEFVARRLDTKSYHSHRCSARSVWPNGRGGSGRVATAGPAGHSTAAPAALEAFKTTRSSCGTKTWRQRGRIDPCPLAMQRPKRPSVCFPAKSAIPELNCVHGQSGKSLPTWTRRKGRPSCKKSVYVELTLRRLVPTSKIE